MLLYILKLPSFIIFLEYSTRASLFLTRLTLVHISYKPASYLKKNFAIQGSSYSSQEFTIDFKNQSDGSSSSMAIVLRALS